jgi:hypothetical protein
MTDREKNGRWAVAEAVAHELGAQQAGTIEGAMDSTLPEEVSQRIAENEALTTRSKAFVNAQYQPELAKLENQQRLLRSEILENKKVLEELGNPIDSLFMTFWMKCSIVCALFSDVFIAEGVMGAFVRGPVSRWIAALGFVTTCCVLGKMALSKVHPQGSLMEKWGVRAIVGSLALLAITSFAWFRAWHLRVIESIRFTGTLRRIVDELGTPVTIVIVIMSVGLALVVAFGSERVERSLQAHMARFKARRLQKRLHDVETAIAIESEEQITLQACQDAEQDVSNARYRRGYIIGSEEGRWAFTLERRRGTFATLAIGGVSLLLALTVSFLVARQLFPAHVLVATLSGGVGLGVVLFVAAFYWMLPRFKSRRRHFRIDHGRIAASVALALSLLTGCSTVPKHSTVIAVDVSGSAQMTDAERLTFIRQAVQYVPRCYTVVVLPVNGESKDSFSVELPCNSEDGYGSDLKAAYESIDREIPTRLRQWAASGGTSDYLRAFKLASEQLVGETKALIVLGDMENTVCTANQCSLPFEAPELKGVSLTGVKVFLGFVPGTRGRATEEFKSSWKSALVKAGAIESNISSPSFGLEGIENWCRNVWGTPNREFADWQEHHQR